MSVQHVTDASFEQEVLKAESPVLVDFWAEWCGPCKMIAPLLDEMARDYGDKLRVVKVNVDENQAVPARYGIRSIPTLMLFSNGEVVETRVGTLSKAQLAQLLDSHL
ncbi:MAG: thioredoxin TrxA [Gammaproteobacteria bacterium]